MRLSYTFAMAALLGYAGSSLAEAPAPSPAPGPNAASNGAAVTKGHPDDAQSMTVDGNGASCDPFYFDAEYILWTMRESPLKSFSVNIPVDFTATNVPNVLVPLVGHGSVGLSPSALSELKSEDLNRNGARLTLGYCLPEGMAVELTYFQLEKKTFASGFSGEKELTFTATAPAVPATTITVNGTVTGAAIEQIELWGLELNCKEHVLVIGCFSVDALCGLRYISLDESVGTAGVLGLTPTGASSGVVITPDSFPFGTFLSTHNRNYLGQVGLAGNLDFGKCAIGGWVKGGFGANDEEANLFGSGVVPGGTNLGRTQMTLMGEWNLNASWQCTDWMRAHVGYNFLYLKNVIRAGGQITGSGALGGGGGLDSVARMKDDKFFAHGFVVGLDFRY